MVVVQWYVTWTVATSFQVVRVIGSTGWLSLIPVGEKFYQNYSLSEVQFLVPGRIVHPTQNQPSPLEINLVCEKLDSEATVILSYSFMLGKHNQLLNSFFSSFPRDKILELENQSDVHFFGDFVEFFDIFSDASLEGKGYWRLIDSNPKCPEPVNWVVLPHVGKLSSMQIDTLFMV
eukprot:TRINITY_DN2624_c0_g3_i14.p1 TRINITY_DN2624_c0_g3~~TRINITY_DN2624_c0_g3_i14.p1  ORF type:complete len:176 (-),score=38.35 TRINITY_DN2624_c0_g3_i14:21-548(-)